MMSKPKISVVKEVDWGCYFLKMPDGKMFSDGEGHFLVMEGNEYDIRAIAAMKKAAVHYGVPDAEVVWKSGARKVTDSEHDDQMERMLDGKIADPIGVEAENMVKGVKGV